MTPGPLRPDAGAARGAPRGRGARRRAVARAMLLAVLLARAAAGEPVEPPADAPEGADYESERADSIEAGSAETGFGATGRSGGRPRTRRRVRFSDGGFAGEAREGAGDPLAGGSVEARGARGRWSVGRLRPAWSRGLVLGGAAEPWRVARAGATAPVPSAGGDGVRWQAGDPRRFGLEALGGHFGRRDVAGARVSLAGVSLGALAPVGPVARRVRPTPAQASLGVERSELALELAMDRAGRWNAEAALERGGPDARLALRVRGGLPGFRPLAGPAAAAPSRALALRLEHGGRAGRAGMSLALWRFRPGLTGSRAALEFEGRLPHHEALAAGLEEQHGARRDPATHPERFRQGAWGEWRGGTDGMALVLRQELWGEAAVVRGAVRSVSAAGVEMSGPARSVLRVSHCAYRVRRGESLYLPEAESDRLVLRALTGVGERTRIELQLPLVGGIARAAAAWTAAASDPPRAQWTLDWNRRASFRRSR